MVWSDDVNRDLKEFLEQFDAAHYERAAHALVRSLEEEAQSKPTSNDLPSHNGNDQGRKDISSLSRLLWHHGVETLVMMLGAYLQAPGAVHAYFLKCRTEDIREIARMLLEDRLPIWNRSISGSFSIENLLQGIHHSAGWTMKEDTIQKFALSLNEMLHSFTREEHRWEYNSIKHGLRVGHGSFALAAGIEDTPGVEASTEAMQLIGYSREASFFDIAKPLKNATKAENRVNFRLDSVSVTWSLEKVLYDLQALSFLISNTVSALKIIGGVPPGTVKFLRPSDMTQWWQQYEALHIGTVPTASFGIDIDASLIDLPTSDDVINSYRHGTWKW